MTGKLQNNGRLFHEQRIFSVLQKSIKQTRRFTGGVLNIQGNTASVETVNANTSFIRNSNLIANGSAIRSIQRGVFSKTITIPYGQAKNYIEFIPVSLANISKSFLIYNLEFGDVRRASYRNEYAVLQSNGININFYATSSSSNYTDGEMTISCDWQVVEFY